MTIPWKELVKIPYELNGRVMLLGGPQAAVAGGWSLTLQRAPSSSVAVGLLCTADGYHARGQPARNDFNFVIDQTRKQ
jgi:hypothetical protein